MEYVYLKNSKRAKSLSKSFSIVILALATINVFLLLTGSKWNMFLRCSLAFNLIIIMALLLFCMHYLWIHDNDRNADNIFYLMQMHLLISVMGLFVGRLDSFSFTVILSLLEMISVILLIDLFSKKRNVLIKIIIALVIISLTMLQLDKYLSLIEMIISIVVLVAVIVNHHNDGFMLFGIVYCSIILVASIVGLFLKFSLVHVIMHYVLDVSAITLTLMIDSKGENS